MRANQYFDHGAARVMTVHRAADRFVTDQPGIRTWHAFSAGAHYDPANVSFGPVIGCDEHLVEPGAGFDWHAHRGVVIVSWVLEGVLRHEDDFGEGSSRGLPRDISAGRVLVQSTGDGIRHRETNPSSADQLRFVQLTLLMDDAIWVDEPTFPVHVNAVGIDLVEDRRTVGPGFLVAGAEGLLVETVIEPGDTARLDRPENLVGRALVAGFAV